MKTLDEIIKRVETQINDFDKNGCFECHYCGDECCIDSCFLEDALHYLKEYQILQTAYIKAMADLEDNPPLTWSELKQMEGKPVWVEYNFQISDKKFRDNSKRWCVIREFEHWHDTEIIITDNGFVLSKNEQVTDWQAYRKERS